MVYSSIQTSSFLITAEQFYVFKKKTPVLMWDSIIHQKLQNYTIFHPLKVKNLPLVYMNQLTISS